jgi:hypothetical protein
MIPRYSRSEMAAIWSAENRYRIWFEIEAHALDAMADLGVVPREAAQKVWAWWRTEPAIDIARIDAIEAETKHDVIAFLTWVSEQVGPEAGAVPAPGDDQLGRARHGAGGAAGARVGPVDRGHGRAAGGAEAARVRA